MQLVKSKIIKLNQKTFAITLLEIYLYRLRSLQEMFLCCLVFMIKKTTLNNFPKCAGQISELEDL